MKKINIASDFDYPLLFITALLVVLGTIMVFSASVIMADIRYKTPYLFVIKQGIWVVLGSAALFFFARFDYRRLQKASKLLMVVAVILLVLVLFVGSARGGAKRWIQWGPLNLQPSEVAKLVLVVALADYLDRRKSRLKQWKGILPVLSIAGVLCGITALEPDLGTPVIMMSATLSLLFIAGARFSHLLILGASCIPVVIEEILRKPYRLQRVKAFIESWGGINSTSYQLNQSILALGSGGFFGKGLAQSQLKLFYLPEPHTDFIFPIIGEELGFIGVMCVMFLFILFTWRGWKISRNSRDYFGGILGIGITFIIAFQAILNMGVACGVFPTKGLPLPFVSFGGSALVINMAEVGILLSISQRGTAKSKGTTK